MAQVAPRRKKSGIADGRPIRSVNGGSKREVCAAVVEV